jgi:hypothetical protein
VNFYRALQGRTPAAIAEAAALTFMGARTGAWPEERRAEMAVFFSRIAYKPTSEWKEEIVCLDPSPTAPLTTRFPDGTPARIASEEDPRKVFAAWLITDSNPWFARNIANRVWSWLLGRGIIHEPDDIRPDNLAANPELLAYLEKELVKARYDLRHLYRLILNSHTYQQSPIARSKHAEAEALFACYPVRRLDAEVLLDALCAISGTGEGYQSAIPEPFTFIPEHQRSIMLADGSISGPFLEMFGRPARDTGLESERNNQPTDSQRMHLLNSSLLQRRIERSQKMRKLLAESARRKSRPELVSILYLSILSRYPTPEESDAAQQYFQTGGLNIKQGAEDLAWALINTKEFLYRH